MKIHPIPYAIFETTRSEFIEILHHNSVSWKIFPLHFFSSNLIYFGPKGPIEVKFSDVLVFGWKFTKFFVSYWNHKPVFLKIFASLFSVMRVYSSLLFSRNFKRLGQKEPSKCKTLRLSTLIMCHENDDWWKIWKWIDLSLQNWHEEFDEF